MEVFVNLVGVSFRGGYAKELVKKLTLDDGELLELRAEPTNEYDPQAVMVIYKPDRTHVGYLARENNHDVFEALERGKELDVKIVGFENSIKPTLLITAQ
jgi:HIRAN domain-containing protein